jgi:hypothetical protein
MERRSLTQYWACFHPGGGFVVKREAQVNYTWGPISSTGYGWRPIKHIKRASRIPESWDGDGKWTIVPISEAEAVLYQLEGKPLCLPTG